LIVFLFCTPRRPPSSPLFPYTTLFRSRQPGGRERPIEDLTGRSDERTPGPVLLPPRSLPDQDDVGIRGSLARDREGPTEVEAASDAGADGRRGLLEGGRPTFESAHGPRSPRALKSFAGPTPSVPRRDS